MDSLRRTLLSLAALFTLSRALSSSSFVVGQEVNTTSGPVIGHAAAGHPLVSEYLGIPFAEPPIGSLRFAAPVPYKAKASITAHKQPPSCVQKPSSYNYSLPEPARSIVGGSGDYANGSSEDCLFLNIWTRFPDVHAAKRPVLIWFFGGGFHGGGANDITEQGAVFAAEEEVVIVNFNYRLGIFGFPVRSAYHMCHARRLKLD